jgi:hypothetical protein
VNSAQKVVGSVVVTVAVVSTAAVLYTVDLLLQVKRKVLG